MKKDPLFEKFNSSIEVDKVLYEEEIVGSIAYARSLHRAGVISEEELHKIVDTLNEIKELQLRDCSYKEDIHTTIEHKLIEKLGAIGKKLHTGRSRNEQIALDERMYLKRKINEIVEEIVLLEKVVIEIAEKNINLIIPGYTHLQQAQPVLFSHYILSLAFMLERDKKRFLDCYKRVDVLPLGSGALAGNPYNLDREFMARELGFSEISRNSIDAVSDRDFLVEFLSCASILDRKSVV